MMISVHWNFSKTVSIAKEQQCKLFSFAHFEKTAWESTNSNDLYRNMNFVQHFENYGWEQKFKALVAYQSTQFYTIQIATFTLLE